MTLSTAVLLMLRPPGDSRAERWVGDAQLAATLDLSDRLLATARVETLTLLAPHVEPGQLPPSADLVLRRSQGPFHFGSELARWTEEQTAPAVAYFGGAAAPLLSAPRLAQLLDQVERADGPLALVNNLHSSDWIVAKKLRSASDYIRTQIVDNGLGWGLREDCGFAVVAQAAEAAFRADLDTPTDAALVAGHPELGPRLRAFLEESRPGSLQDRVERLAAVLTTRGQHLGIFGRSSSSAWQAVERCTQLWVRLIVEERGMLASGRQQRGEVRTVLAPAMESRGIEGFVDWLESLLGGVLWDTRVWMAAKGEMPPAADRFAADLGWHEEVQDPELRRLTRAIEASKIPIVTGGHGAVAGSLMAFLETLVSQGRLEAYQPSK